MINPQETGWTIEELAERVSERLAADGVWVRSGRVRDVPDRRTIRYYTTLGLLDRPSAMVGRTAYYGQRHVLQLVAIKKLQARGLSLAEVQHRLLGQADSVLEALAAAIPDVEQEPVLAAAPTPSNEVGVEAVRLDPSTALVLKAVRPLTDQDRRLIRMATAPLLELLRLHGLIGLASAPPEEAKDGQSSDTTDG